MICRDRSTSRLLWSIRSVTRASESSMSWNCFARLARSSALRPSSGIATIPVSLTPSIPSSAGIRMADTRADQCRKNAADCRQQASKAPEGAEKTAWLKMATDWLSLAESLDASAKGTRKPNSKRDLGEHRSEVVDPVVTSEAGEQ